MSTQPFSQELPKSPELPQLPELEAQLQRKSLLDEPWKVRLVPEPPRLPPGVLPAPQPHEAKSQPWRRGDVTRLKDDSPKGMMEYIATHTNGWWQELAERALRDTEKAERMAREAGWQPGQCWALEVDAEAKQKLLEAEEAKRQREEAQRAKDAADKEAFMQRQMELLKKAGRAPRCEYLYTDGRGCRAPQVKGERWCHGHAKAMSYRPEKLEMELMEDEQAVMVNLYRVTKSLLAGRISEKTAGLMLWSVAIGAPSAGRIRKTHHGGTETRRKTSSDRKGKPKTFAAQRNGGSRGEKNHSGVTQRKSFKSGVRQGSTPAIAEIARNRTTSKKQNPKSLKHRGTRVSRGSVTQEPQTSVSPCLRGEKSSPNQEGAQSRGNEWFRENSLNRHGQGRHSRGPSTPPHSPSTGSGSLGVGRDDSGKERRGPSEFREAIIESQNSVSPCLRGESELRTTKGTKDHEEATQKGEHLSEYQLVHRGPAFPIRVDRRESAVGSCSSSVSPCLRGENESQEGQAGL